MNDERLPETAAKRVLDRASALEVAHASSVPVDALREAARDAGISAAAFEAALAEERRGALTRTPPRRSPWRALSVMLVVVLVAGTFIIPLILPKTAASTANVPLVDETLTLRCLDGAAAAEIARGQLQLQENEITFNADAPRVLRVKATADQMARVKSALDAAESQAPNCSTQKQN